jgi:hypothetical protein
MSNQEEIGPQIHPIVGWVRYSWYQFVFLCDYLNLKIIASSNFFNNMRSKNHQFSFFLNIQNWRNINLGYFQNLKKPTILMKEVRFYGWLFDYLIFEKSWLYIYQSHSFDLLRIMVMNF